MLSYYCYLVYLLGLNVAVHAWNVSDIPQNITAVHVHNATFNGVACFDSTSFPKVNRSVNCHVVNFCHLPPSLVEPPSPSQKCASPLSHISALYTFNIISAIFCLLLGHQKIRDKLPQLFRSDHWTPASGVSSVLLQMFAMLISTAVARRGSYKPSFGALLSLWIMRPRMAWVSWGGVLFGHASYFWTFLDFIFAECVLNIVSLPVAMSLRPHIGEDGFGCQIAGWSPGSSLRGIRTALALVASIGVLSILLLAGLLFFYLSSPNDFVFLYHGRSRPNLVLRRNLDPADIPHLNSAMIQLLSGVWTRNVIGYYSVSDDFESFHVWGYCCGLFLGVFSFGVNYALWGCKYRKALCRTVGLTG